MNPAAGLFRKRWLGLQPQAQYCEFFRPRPTGASVPNSKTGKSLTLLFDVFLFARAHARFASGVYATLEGVPRVHESPRSGQQSLQFQTVAPRSFSRPVLNLLLPPSI